MEQGAMEESEQWVLKVLEGTGDIGLIEQDLEETQQRMAGINEPLNIDVITGPNKKPGLPQWAEVVVW